MVTLLNQNRTSGMYVTASLPRFDEFDKNLFHTAAIR